MSNKTAGVFLIDITKCSDDENDDLVWLALAQYLDGKRCAVCGHIYNSRESTIAHSPLEGYNGDVVGKECWEIYLANRQKQDGVQV
jgi:hypothetical protein